MTEKTIEIEAETLEEAREQVKSQIPEGLHLLSEQVVSDGKPKTVRAVADTTESAFTKAQSKIPTNAVIIEKKELTPPTQKMMTVEAFDEQSAKAQVESQIGKTETIKTLRLAMAGKKGLLGIGKNPNQYQAEVFQRAVVKITYKAKAKISATIGEKKPEAIKLAVLTHQQNRRARAVEWWKGKDSSSKQCDICSMSISPNEGYLLDTKEMLSSRKYIDYATSLRSAESIATKMPIAGMDPVVMKALMPAIDFTSRLEVTSDIEKVTTPWLVCENCLGKYFTDT